MSLRLFITGTDTGVGKTYIAASLLHTFRKLDYTTLGIKPVASGCITQAGKLYNDDVVALQKASSIQLAYEQINPLCL